MEGNPLSPRGDILITEEHKVVGYLLEEYLSKILHYKNVQVVHSNKKNLKVKFGVKATVGLVKLVLTKKLIAPESDSS